MSDGAAALMLGRRSTVEALGLPILGVLKASAVVGVPPDVMGIGPAYAIPAALEQAGVCVCVCLSVGAFMVLVITLTLTPVGIEQSRCQQTVTSINSKVCDMMVDNFILSKIYVPPCSCASLVHHMSPTGQLLTKSEPNGSRIIRLS